MNFLPIMSNVFKKNCLTALFFVFFQSYLMLSASPDRDRKNVFAVGHSINFPIGSSEERYASTIGYPYLSFRFHLGDEVRVGVYHEFKRFKLITNAEDLNLRIFGEELNYVTRLYHPIYGVFGPKIFLAHSLQDPLFFSEAVNLGQNAYRSFGAALTFGVLYKLDKKWDVNFHFDRWLLIGASKLYGWECALDIGYRFDFPS